MVFAILHQSAMIIKVCRETQPDLVTIRTVYTLFTPNISGA